MDLYINKNGVLQGVRSVPFKSEKEIQNLIEKNLETVYGLEFVRTEFTVKNFRIDTLCFDPATQSFVVIEYKKKKNYSVIDQGYTYMSLLLNNKSDFILEYNETLGKSLKKASVDWAQSRVIFVSPSYTEYQKHSVEFRDVPFELWEIKQFSNGTVSLNRHKSSSTESVTTVAGNDEVIANVSREVKVYNVEDHRVKGNDEIKELYDTYAQRILELDGVEIAPTKEYIGFKLGKRIITDLEIQKSALKVRINMKWGELNDSEGLFRNVSSIGHYGVGDYECKINDEEHLDYILSLVRICYNHHND